jgi:hypothetical protein
VELKSDLKSLKDLIQETNQEMKQEMKQEITTMEDNISVLEAVMFILLLYGG